MIDFRYHLVSIIAVFLALAIGIVVGSTALQPTVESSLHKAQSLLNTRIGEVSKKNTALGQQVDVASGFAQAAAGRLLGGLLTGQTVVLVTAPGADSQVISGVTSAVRQAGGKVTGTLSLEPQFFDDSDSTETKLTQTSQSLAATAGISLAGQLTGDIVAQQQAAQLIAAAIVSKDGPGLGATESRTILDGLGQGSYVQISGPGSGQTLVPATLAVVVAPASAPSSDDGGAANLSLIAVAEQLQAGSLGAVLAGSLSGSGSGSAVDQASGGGKVTTIDNADSPVGQVITVQALADLLAGDPPDSYGAGPDAVPSPAPTPSAAPTPTVAAHVRKK